MADRDFMELQEQDEWVSQLVSRGEAVCELQSLEQRGWQRTECTMQNRG